MLTQKDRESVSDKRWAPFADLFPSIHLSFPSSAPSTVPSVHSVILSVPSVLLPLSSSGQSLADLDKRMLPVMEKEQRSWLSGGGGGWLRWEVRRWPGVRVGEALSYVWLSIVVPGLAPDPTPTLHISSVWDFHHRPPFPRATVFSGLLDGKAENWKCDSCPAWIVLPALWSGCFKLGGFPHCPLFHWQCWLLHPHLQSGWKLCDS